MPKKDYLFNALVHLIENKILVGMQTMHPFSPHARTRLLLEVGHEAEAIKQKLAELSNHLPADELTLYVRLHQGKLGNIIGSLAHPLQRKSHLTEDLDPFLQDVLDVVVTLLRHLGNFYARQFNHGLPVPYTCRVVFGMRFRQQIRLLESAFSEMAIDTALAEIVLRPLREYTDALRPPDLAYQRLLYLLGLIGELTSFCKAKPADPLRALHILLRDRGFNAPGYIQYCKEQICREVAAMPPGENIHTVATFEAFVNTPSLKKTKLYDPEQCDTAAVLLTWVEVGNKLTKRLRVTGNLFGRKGLEPLEQVEPAEDEDASDIPDDERISLTLSVPELALLIRMLIEKDIIKLKKGKRSAFLRRIAAVVMTEGTDNPSFDSLRNNYNKPPRSAYNTWIDFNEKFTKYLLAKRPAEALL